jgi:hypothetical protein
MANLLLDRTFDPQGLICSLLSQAMSSSTVPNRGCYNGAVDDMQVSSFATTNFLNLGVHPTDIEVHGLATVFDPNTIPDVSFAAAPFGVGPFLVARLLRSCGISLVDDVFNHDDSDLIVSATSQTGGLSGYWPRYIAMLTAEQFDRTWRLALRLAGQRVLRSTRRPKW